MSSSISIQLRNVDNSTAGTHGCFWSCLDSLKHGTSTDHGMRAGTSVTYPPSWKWDIFNREIIDNWGSFHCHVWIPKGTIWLFNSLPWKDPPFLSLVNPGKPSISMVHLYHVKLLVITRLGRFILIPMMVHWSPSQSTKISNPYSTCLYFSEQLWENTAVKIPTVGSYQIII